MCHSSIFHIFNHFQLFLATFSSFAIHLDLQPTVSSRSLAHFRFLHPFSTFCSPFWASIHVFNPFHTSLISYTCFQMVSQMLAHSICVLDLLLTIFDYFLTIFWLFSTIFDHFAHIFDLFLTISNHFWTLTYILTHSQPFPSSPGHWCSKTPATQAKVTSPLWGLILLCCMDVMQNRIKHVILFTHFFYIVSAASFIVILLNELLQDICLARFSISK